MNIVVGVAAAVAAGSGVGVGLADPRTRHRKKASKSTEKTRTQACPNSDFSLEHRAIGESKLHTATIPSPALSFVRTLVKEIKL